MFLFKLLVLMIASILVHTLNASITSEPDAHIALTPGREIALKCKANDYPDVEFTWHRVTYDTNHSLKIEKEQVLPVDNKYILDKTSLILKSPTFFDVGEYFCKVKDTNDFRFDQTEKRISVLARPIIYDFDLPESTARSAVVEEGSSLKLACNVIDEFSSLGTLKIMWQMSKYDENDMNEVSPHNDEGIEIEQTNASCVTLLLKKVTQEHRKFYRCNVTNGRTDNSKSIYIRVRNKYTAIWPAGAIALEIVILLGIIFVVDSRKVEPDRETNEKIIQM